MGLDVFIFREEVMYCKKCVSEIKQGKSFAFIVNIRLFEIKKEKFHFK